MNRTKTQKKRLTVLAAICSSVFLLAACEPGTEQTGETTDDSAPTYGEPDRDPMTEDPATTDPADTGTESWEEDTSTPEDPNAPQ